MVSYQETIELLARCNRETRLSTVKMIKPLSIEKEAQIPLHLIEEVRNSTAVLFVGSGLSIPLGYPSWKNLVSTLYKKIEKNLAINDEENRKWLKDNFATQPDWSAEVINSASHGGYFTSIREIFNKSGVEHELSWNHMLLSMLPFRSYITTNYDTLIEDYVSVFQLSPPSVYDYEEALNNYLEYKNSERPVLKLHGCADKNIEKIILTSSDYYNLLNDDRYIRLLSSIFSENTILCIGFSLKDRDFRFFLEERFHLYEKRCPPLYAVISDNETCPLEINLLRDKYNVHILLISDKDNFSELTSFLYSLYCIVHREDSAAIKPDFLNNAGLRVQNSGHFRNTITSPYNPDESLRVKKILSVFKEPINYNILIAICMEHDINISSSACFTLVDKSIGNKVYLKNPIIELGAYERKAVSAWISADLKSIPVTSSARHFTSYHKEIFGRYSKTISYLLRFPEGWSEIIGNDDQSTYSLIRVTQYFKQEGMWKSWLEIADNARNFVQEGTETHKELLQSILWIYFWTRRFEEASKLLSEYPELDEKKGEHAYSERLLYMQTVHTKKLIDKLHEKDELDYFGYSLLGRSYALLYLLDGGDKNNLLKSKELLVKALSEAEENGDWIERSVQSWYLSMVLSDLGEIESARSYLAEVKRLDENIMNRVPGIAWLKLAEYRMCINDEAVTSYKKDEIKEETILAFEKLGVIEVESFIDNEYYY